MKRITVLISGSGSNLQALIDAQKNGQLTDTEIVSVISSSKKAYGLERAKKVGIPTTIHSLYSYNNKIPKENKEERYHAREKFEADLAKIVKDTKPDIIVCAGWLLILGNTFLNELISIPIINLHPALPGQFDGTTHAIEMAWNQCQNDGKPLISGCMVHYVVQEVDKGEPIVIQELEIIPGKQTLEEYENEIHNAEHKIIVTATKKVLGIP